MKRKRELAAKVDDWADSSEIYGNKSQTQEENWFEAETRIDPNILEENRAKSQEEADTENGNWPVVQSSTKGSSTLAESRGVKSKNEKYVDDAVLKTFKETRRFPELEVSPVENKEKQNVESKDRVDQFPAAKRRQTEEFDKDKDETNSKRRKTDRLSNSERRPKKAEIREVAEETSGENREMLRTEAERKEFREETSKTKEFDEDSLGEVSKIEATTEELGIESSEEMNKIEEAEKKEFGKESSEEMNKIEEGEKKELGKESSEEMNKIEAEKKELGNESSEEMNKIEAEKKEVVKGISKEMRDEEKTCLIIKVHPFFAGNAKSKFGLRVQQKSSKLYQVTGFVLFPFISLLNHFKLQKIKSRH
jgi:hypothetical protein